MNKTLKNIEMVQTYNRLDDFIRKDIVVPVALSAAISANMREIKKELEPYEEVRQSLLQQSDDTEIDTKFKELCNLEVEVRLRSVSPGVFDNLDLSTKDYMALEFMIDEENIEEPKSQSA